jgi:ADP-ribose pyrophosphatase
MRKAEVVHRAECYRGFYRMERVALRHDRHSGTTTPTLTRELVSRSDIVAVLPYDPVTDKVVLIEQFRPGALVAGGDPWLLEIVAGHLEPGEAPEDAARRETFEETHCDVRMLTKLATYFLAPNLSPDQVHLFWAEVSAPPVEHLCGRDDEDEDIRVIPVDRTEAFAMTGDGRITSPWTLLALVLLQQRMRPA